MSPYFINALHRDRFIRMTHDDHMSPHDSERASLFYILSGNEELYTKRNYIYDYREHSIHLCLQDSPVDFSSGLCSLIRLGFNLYNGWSDKYTSPLYLLGNLDRDNLLLAENAIRIRFSNTLLKNLVDG